MERKDLPRYIGQRIQQYYGMPEAGEFVSPTARLGKIVEDLSVKLKMYKQNPNANDGYIRRQSELIWNLLEIHRQLETLEPLDIWTEINQRVQRVVAFDDSDLVTLLFPLKPQLPEMGKISSCLINLTDQPDDVIRKNLLYAIGLQ
ncbi:hypothetical protein [Dysgonomonas macrotermitis]|uniref:Uncharacterized protein n=1 Tax=Dysgonomonas macrotermitis TaxID=1346286 RepID=A0A1M4ZD92_9BACT|nr:hypothetical protein [Dysgonomonas macrotermitis]SHF15546.1 hypothetical protein SAMN05444362_10444 [Dysgonomonas macrotermitis]